VAATTVLQVAAHFPGEPFLLYYVAVVASASVLGRTAGFVAVAATSIASLLYWYVAIYPLPHAIDLLAILIYALIAALSAEAFGRLVDGALTERSEAVLARLNCKEMEKRLSARAVQHGLTHDSEARFRATFDNAAVGIAHVAPDGRCLRVNEALCRILGYPVGELLTKSIQDIACPDDFAADLARVHLMREGKIDSYDAEARYLRKDGAIIWARKTVSCVRKDEGSIDYFVCVIEDITAHKHAERELRENEARFRLSLLHSPLPVMLFDDREHIVVVSQSWLEQSGYLREDLRRVEDWTIRAYGKHSEVVLGKIREIMIASTEPPEVRSAELMISTKDGRERLWSFVSSGLPTRFDERRLFISVAQDVTDQKAHEEQVHLLMREIDHRARNMLSLVQIIARQTAACEPRDFIERFTHRIQALAVNQDLLARNDWQGVGVDDLVRAQLARFADLVGSRIMVHGPPVRLNPAAAQGIGLALHELATNAGNYGALSTEAGRLEVDWQSEGDVFTMNWTERDGPSVRPPERRGFGSTVIGSMAGRALSAEVQLEYASSGLVWHLVCPAANALERTTKPGTAMRYRTDGSLRNPHLSYGQ
jgi:PAS domain S-box-containing protein